MYQHWWQAAGGDGQEMFIWKHNLELVNYIQDNAVCSGEGQNYKEIQYLAVTTAL